MGIENITLGTLGFGTEGVTAFLCAYAVLFVCILIVALKKNTVFVGHHVIDAAQKIVFMRGLIGGLE